MHETEAQLAATELFPVLRLRLKSERACALEASCVACESMVAMSSPALQPRMVV